MEKTLVILKPDTLKRKLVGEVISRIERKNLDIINMKLARIDRETAETHYNHVRKEPIFDDMINYFTSNPVIIMIIEGEKAIQIIRTMIGKTNILEAAPGTIRGDYGSVGFKNLIHASDSQESAEIEIKRFFPEL